MTDMAKSGVPSSIADRLYRLSFQQYRAMVEANILTKYDKIELLEGLMVHKRPKTHGHVIATELTHGVLMDAIPDGWFCSMQNPIAMPESDSEPEPDAKIVRGKIRDYTHRYVEARDVALVVEAADASLPEDQGFKKFLYARASIPFYWIINIPANRLEIYSDPTGPEPSPDYRRRTEFGPEDVIPLILDGREVARIAVGDILPQMPPATDR